MLMAVTMQLVAVLVLALIAGLVSGLPSLLDAVLGGAAAIIPNSLFALRLASHRGRSAESYPVVFFLGEFAKIGLTIALLAAIHKWFEPVNWLWVLLGLIVALKAPLAMWFIRPSSESPAIR
jgi:ATP synthase protein I